MNPLEETIKEIVEKATTNSTSKHFCPICKREVAKYEFVLFGKKKLVQPRCKCEVEQEMNELKQMEKAATQRENDKLFAKSTLGKKYENCTFDNFELRKGTEKAHQLTSEFAENFESKKNGLILTGEPGNGKSHLTSAVVNQLNGQGYISIFINVPEFLEQLKQTFSKSSNESESSYLEPLIKCDLLVLDEIGHKKASYYDADVLYRIIDRRYRQEKKTLYTSNMRLDQLVNILTPKDDDFLGKKIVDRIIETCTPIDNQGTSYRQELAKLRRGQ